MARGNVRPVILAFGGLDPTGGAGILMDAKAALAAGGHAAGVASCLTLQTTRTFLRVAQVSRAVIEESLRCAADSFSLRAVKIGAVWTRCAAAALLRFLEDRPGIPVVLDPVLRSSSGGALISRAALPAYRMLLLRAAVLTPNLGEAEKILGRRIRGFDDAVSAAGELYAATGASVVLKGGHFPWKGTRGTDIVFETKGRVTLLPPAGGPGRPDAHGTGCALASFIAVRIASGEPLVPAVRAARKLLDRWVSGGFPSAEGRWTMFSRP